MPNRLPLRYAGDAIIIVVGTIAATGAAGKRGVLAQKIHRPVNARACFRFSHETGMIACALFRARYQQELMMKSWIGAALVAGVVVLAGPASLSPATAAQPQAAAQKADAGKATDISAQRRYYRRHYHYGYRPYDRPYYQPHYYARPYYYRPYPYYAPAPFTFGFGFGPYGW
jgi:hypothetical protein